MAAYVFIDNRVNNVAALIAALAPDMRVVTLNSEQDGIAQIAQSLHGVADVDAVHIISHGSDGVLYLGGGIVDSGNLDHYRGELAAIGASLTDGSDILLYGCDVAATQTGQHFIDQLASLTGADVAASTDVTGAAGLGGDWLLEAQTDAIESAVLSLADFAGLLDVINGDNNPNSLPGTINNDLITGLGGNDTIDGAAGFDTSIYNGPSTGYGFARSGTSLIVTDVNPANGNEGADQLANVEAAQFTDGTISFGQTGESRVNTYVTNTQANSSVAALASGGFVVTWQSADQDGSNYGIYTQRYGANGMALGSEVRVNATTVFKQESPATAGLTGGGFVVAWMSNHAGGFDDIYAQRYDANGNALGGEFRVNTYATLTSDQGKPAIIALANGGFVVTWQSFNQVQPNSNYDIYFQRYDANGVAQGEELRANTLISGPQVLSAITQLTSGELVIVWDSPFEITAQRFDSIGGVQGLEFVVNTYTAGTQSAPTIAALSGGGFVVTWHSLNQDGSGYGIYAQRFNATGLALGPEFRVNTITLGNQTNPAIAPLSNGGFVVAWESADSGTFDIYAQRYDANGAALGGEFRINVNTFNSQLTAAITALADGGFVVTWESAHDDPNYDVYARRFDAAGNPVGETSLTGDAANNVLRWTGADTVLLDGGGGNDLAAQGGDSGGCRFSLIDGNMAITDVDPGNGAEGVKKLLNIEAAQFTDGTVAIGPVNEFRVNTFITNSQDAPAIATLADGGYVVAWNSFGQDNAFSYGVYAQRYDAAGRTQGAEFRVNTFAATDQLAPTIAALSNGGFVVAWQSNDQDGNQYGIYAQRYDAAGNPQGGEFRANTVTADQQIDPAITALANGGFVVTWASANQAGAGSSIDIYARRYDANGVAQGNEFLVNTFTSNIQDAPAVAALVNGGFVVTWESANQLAGNGYDIYARRYDANGVATDGVFQVDQTAPNNQIQPSIAVLRDGGFVVTYLNDGNTGYFLNRFDANGVAQGVDFQIALSGLAYGIAPVTALADGGFVVAYWTNGGGNDVYVQRFNAAGVKVGSEIRVNSTTANAQELPMVSAFPDGGFVVAWQSNDQDGSFYGIYARRFDASGNPVATTLTGDGGNNNIVWSGTQAVVLDGGAGADTLTGSSGNDTYFTDGLDVINELVNAGTDRVLSSAANFSLGDNLENLTLIGIGNISGGGNALANRLFGNNGNNGLFGDLGNDLLSGNAGDDVLIGGAGGDTLAGGAGTDTAIGQDGNDLISGDDGIDLLYGYADIDTLNGGNGGDLLSGGLGNDQLNGGEDGDALFGEEGDDTLNGDNGDDVLIGGAGNDTLNGGAGGDTLIGEAGNEIMAGGDGNDQMFGYGDLDTLNGGDGNDFLAGGDGNDQLNGDAGGDVLDGEAQNDLLNGGADGDNLNGNFGNDTLNGGAGADGMLGWDGDDVLDGETGNDYMYGDRPDGTGLRGNDRFVFQDGTGNDLIADFQGGAGVGDVIDLRGLGFANFSAVQAASSNVNGGVFINLDAGNPGGSTGDALFIAGIAVVTINADDFLLV